MFPDGSEIKVGDIFNISNGVQEWQGTVKMVSEMKLYVDYGDDYGVRGFSISEVSQSRLNWFLLRYINLGAYVQNGSEDE